MLKNGDDAYVLAIHTPSDASTKKTHVECSIEPVTIISIEGCPWIDKPNIRIKYKNTSSYPNDKVDRYFLSDHVFTSVEQGKRMLQLKILKGDFKDKRVKLVNKEITSEGNAKT